MRRRAPVGILLSVLSTASSFTPGAILPSRCATFAVSRGINSNYNHRFPHRRQQLRLAMSGGGGSGVKPIDVLEFWFGKNFTEGKFDAMESAEYKKEWHPKWFFSNPEFDKEVSAQNLVSPFEERAYAICTTHCLKISDGGAFRGATLLKLLLCPTATHRYRPEEKKTLKLHGNPPAEREIGCMPRAHSILSRSATAHALIQTPNVADLRQVRGDDPRSVKRRPLHGRVGGAKRPPGPHHPVRPAVSQRLQEAARGFQV